MSDQETTAEAKSPATEMTLDEAVAAFERLFAVVDDAPTHGSESHAPNGAVYERYVVPAKGQSAAVKNPKPASFETRGAAAEAWLAAVTARFASKGQTKLWWRARPRIIKVEPGDGVTVYSSLATGA